MRKRKPNNQLKREKKDAKINVKNDSQIIIFQTIRQIDGQTVQWIQRNGGAKCAVIGGSGAELNA